MRPQNEVTQLLSQVSSGDPEAATRLVPLVYDELRRLAAHYLRRERTDHTLQPTALVHEAYMRLVGQRVRWQNRAHFMGIAAQVMRRILIDYARRRDAGKRGGPQQKVLLEESLALSEERSLEIMAIDEALLRLAEINARQSRIVELRFFGGLTIEQAAEVLGISTVAVKRDWNLAKAWLYREIRKGNRGDAR